MLDWVEWAQVKKVPYFGSYVDYEMEEEFLRHGIGIQPTEEAASSAGVLQFTGDVMNLYKSLKIGVVSVCTVTLSCDRLCGFKGESQTSINDQEAHVQQEPDGDDLTINDEITVTHSEAHIDQKDTGRHRDADDDGTKAGYSVDAMHIPESRTPCSRTAVDSNIFIGDDGTQGLIGVSVRQYDLR